MKPLKIAIFDLDGVLFDSKESNRQYYDTIARLTGRGPLTEEEFAFCHMHTAEESISFMFRDSDEMRIKAMEIASGIDYGDFMKYMSMEPGMEETVSGLKKLIKTAISTNRSTTMPRLTAIYGLDRLFDVIVSALDVERPKPDPEGVFKILDEFGLSGEEAIYIGDSKVDEETARNSGVRFIAFRNRGLDADYHAEDLFEVGRIVRSLI